LRAALAITPSQDQRVLYVGKAKRLRTRLLTYFRARFPRQ
jgi:excinuclease UvrABC nuclease subunit